MPIVVKTSHKKLVAELSLRFDELHRLLALRDLRHASEGSKDGTDWPAPERMGVTFGSDADIRLAVDTVKAVLGEVRKIKTANPPKATDPIPAHDIQQTIVRGSEPDIM